VLAKGVMQWGGLSKQQSAPEFNHGQSVKAFDARKGRQEIDPAVGQD